VLVDMGVGLSSTGPRGARGGPTQREVAVCMQHTALPLIGRVWGDGWEFFRVVWTMRDSRVLFGSDGKVTRQFAQMLAGGAERRQRRQRLIVQPLDFAAGGVQAD